MYGDMMKGCGPTLVVLCVLALFGLGALIYLVIEFFIHINITWS